MAGRRAVPDFETKEDDAAELPTDDIPTFESEEAAENAPGGKPMRYQIVSGTPLTSAAPAPFRAAPAAKKMDPAPKLHRYRVLNLPPEGKNYISPSGQMARLLPNKILDDRYFDVEFMQQQGFALQEVDSSAQQIGMVMTRRSLRR
jgi:hypothetical protein